MIVRKEINFLDWLICDLQLPREPDRSSRLLLLTGRLQYDGIMWLALRSVTSINVDIFLSDPLLLSSYPIIKIKIGFTFIFRFHRRSIQIVLFFPVGLSSFSWHFKQVLLGVEVSSVSWLGQLTFGVQITDYFNYWVSKFLLLLCLSCWSWSSNLWWGEKFVHWVVLSCDDLIE